jgi:hypothetical protein
VERSASTDYASACVITMRVTGLTAFTEPGPRNGDYITTQEKEHRTTCRFVNVEYRLPTSGSDDAVRACAPNETSSRSSPLRLQQTIEEFRLLDWLSVAAQVLQCISVQTGLCTETYSLLGRMALQLETAGRFGRKYLYIRGQRVWQARNHVHNPT